MRWLLIALPLWLSTLAAPAAARPRQAMGAPRPARTAKPTPGRVAVQPIDAPDGRALRGQIARLLRARKVPVVTTLAAVSGTAQYPGLARDRRIAAFVVTEVEDRPNRRALTFLVWHGSDGSVAARWAVSAPPRRLNQALSKGFWKNLGPALLAARTPPSGRLGRGPTLRIDAGSPSDEPIVSDSDLRRGPGVVR